MLRRHVPSMLTATARRRGLANLAVDAPHPPPAHPPPPHLVDPPAVLGFPPDSPHAAFISAELQADLERLHEAQRQFASFTQAKVDKIFDAAAFAMSMKRLHLAKLAVEETKMGVVEDKVIKNHFASEIVHNKYRKTKTCGVVFSDPDAGIEEVAYPVGPILGVVPVTNPTSTVAFKGLLALKTRNAVMFAPHPRAAKCARAAMQIMLDAAVAEGAPADCLKCAEMPSVQVCQALMRHPLITFILATGAGKMVREAYSSGKPAIGVGAGNCPAVIDEFANVKRAVNNILISKSFDNGVTCACEQAIVVVDAQREALFKELAEAGCVILRGENRDKITATMYPKDPKDPHLCVLNPNVVGQPPRTICEMAGIDHDALVGPDAKHFVTKPPAVIVDMTDVPFDIHHPMTHEKICPVLSVYRATDYRQAFDIAKELVAKYGCGHTALYFTKEEAADRRREFELLVPASRILFDMPAVFGAIGDVYNFALAPAMTLGCGSSGGNSFAGNVGVKNLLNIKVGAHRRENMQYFKVPPAIYFKSHILNEGLKDLPKADCRRALIITDPAVSQLPLTRKVVDTLNDLGLTVEIFDQVKPDPDTAIVNAAVEVCKSFRPDCIVALGGGSPLDAAKVTRLCYEHPEMSFEQLTCRFLDIRKRTFEFPNLGSLVKKVVCVPTTSGTGAEVTPFAVLTDSVTQRKYPIASYEITPDIAIVDSSLTYSMPTTLAAHTGFDALVHAIESYVSVFATSITKPLSAEAVRQIFGNLAASVADGENHRAREAMHHASLQAGLAFSNAFLGIVHSVAHQIGSQFHVPHGLACALALVPCIRYNATRHPSKRTAFSQYTEYRALDDYAELATLVLGADRVAGLDADARVEALIDAIERLKVSVGVPLSMAEAVRGQATAELFESVVPQMAEKAFDDQCTGTNPRFPLIEDLEKILRSVWEGNGGHAKPSA